MTSTIQAEHVCLSNGAKECMAYSEPADFFRDAVKGKVSYGLEGKSAQGTLNPIFPRAGGTLTNQGTIMTKLSLRHKFLYRNSGFRSKLGELIIRIWMVMEGEIQVRVQDK